MSTSEELIRRWTSAHHITVHEDIDLVHEFRVVQSVCVADSQRSLRGVVAKKALCKGDLIVRIASDRTIAPLFVSMSATHGDLCDEQSMGDFHTHISHLQTYPSLWTRLVLALLREMHIGTKSLFYEYLQTLPTEYDNLINWSEEERKHLEATSVLLGLSTMPSSYIMENNIISLTKGFEHYFGELSIDKVRMAASAVLSRSFMDKEVSIPSMIPIIDLFNHTWTDLNTELTFHDGVYELHAARDIQAGEQIYNTYGNLSNGQLLNTYGFVIPGNQIGWFPIHASVVVDTCIRENWKKKDEKMLQQRVDFLQKAGIFPTPPIADKAHQEALSSLTFFPVTHKDRIPDNLRSSVMTLLMSPEEYSDLDKDEKATKSKVDHDLIVKTNTCLLKIVHHYIDLFPTKLHEDEGMLKRTNLSNREWMALIVRMNDRKLLLDIKADIMKEILQSFNHADSDGDDLDSNDDDDDEDDVDEDGTYTGDFGFGELESDDGDDDQVEIVTLIDTRERVAAASDNGDENKQKDDTEPEAKRPRTDDLREQ